MGKDSQKRTFGQFINQIKAIVLGLFGFVSAVVGFITLAQGNTGIFTGVLLAIGISLFWLACIYFARFWMPEDDDGKVELILPPLNDQVVKQQRKEERLRKYVRRAALSGVVLVPLLSISSYGAWMYIQHESKCEIFIKENTDYIWTTKENESPHNKGELIITDIDDDGKWTGLQNRSENIHGQMSGKSFTLFVPSWQETWKGICSQNHITGDITRDNDEHFTFTIDLR